jgi:flagellar biosynthesis/type III secretory pathway M-ring protein FliF/YscJ
MVSTLVKKGSPTAAFATPALAGGVAEMMSANEAPMGEVGTADPSLDGLELDPEAIRSQQVAQQVTSLVKENPDSAAALVKRWLNRT